MAVDEELHGGVDDKEMELETWPAFVDILSSTVVALAFAFFILVVMLSISKITTSSDSEGKKSEQSGGSAAIQNALLSKSAATYPKISIVSPSIMAKNQESKSITSEKTEEKIILVPEKAKVTEKSVKVTEPGENTQQVLGEVPKFTDSRVIEVLKEFVIVQQDIITQQRKVIEQQDQKIEQTTKEYQSLLSVITKQPEVEDLHQESNAKPDQAKFNPIDDKGERLTGVAPAPKGKGVYILSPPNIAIKGVELVKSADKGSFSIVFKDNANYLRDQDIDKLKKELAPFVDVFKDKGVTLTAKPSDFSISSAEGKRIAVDRLILIRSMLVDMGVGKNLIKFKSLDSVKNDKKEAEEESNYGWVEIAPGY